MKEIEIKTVVKEYDYGELAPEMQALVEKAKANTYKAYAPYSHFSVGAAILLSNGVVVDGANQENAAYPSGTCAERSACYYAHAQYPDAKFEAIAIAARDTHGHFTTGATAPCGACRQALLEYEMLTGHPVRVLLASADKVYEFESVASLLPLSFCSFD